MTARRQLDRVRTKAIAVSVFDGRTVPAGTGGHGSGSQGGRDLHGGSGAHAANL
jgi:hypothetical protein